MSATPVSPAEPGKKTSTIMGPTSDEATVQMSKESENCFWNDQEFPQGARIEVDGSCYECSFGSWVTVEG